MVGIDKLILSSIGGSIVTIIINSFIKRHEKQENLKKQTKIFIQFVDNIIIRYLTIFVNEYNKIIEEIDSDKLFEVRIMTESPMLNKNIFDFFEKTDLIKIFSYCKKNSLVEVYHNFHEIEFLQKNTPLIMLRAYTTEILDHYEKHKRENETLDDHKTWCEFYKQQKNHLIEDVKIQKTHMETLIESFNQIKNELIQIDELNDDDD